MIRQAIQSLAEKNKTHFDRDIKMEVPDFAYKVTIDTFFEEEFPKEILKALTVAMKSTGVNDEQPLYSLWSTLDEKTRKWFIVNTNL